MGRASGDKRQRPRRIFTRISSLISVRSNATALRICAAARGESGDGLLAMGYVRRKVRGLCCEFLRPEADVDMDGFRRDFAPFHAAVIIHFMCREVNA